MENSIEEDTMILENWVEELNELFKNTYINNAKEQKALEHILSDYKRVLKENKELRESNKKLYEIGQEMCKQDKYTSENYISVQKIKDKIEELKQEDRNWTEELSEPDGNFKIIDRNLKRIKNQIDVLQELIEESEEK